MIFRIRDAAWQVRYQLALAALTVLRGAVYVAVAIAWLANVAHTSLSARSEVLAETLGAQSFVEDESPLAEVVLLGTFTVHSTTEEN